eukprot:2021100-Amphidinium_carterae.1
MENLATGCVEPVKSRKLRRVCTSIVRGITPRAALRGDAPGNNGLVMSLFWLSGLSDSKVACEPSVLCPHHAGAPKTEFCSHQDAV